MIIYSSEEMYVVFHPGDSDYLLITFGFNGLNPDERNESFWAKPLCSKLKLNAIGFMPRRSLWYPASHTLPAIFASEQYLAKFERRIAYGSSMGGYAALRYGKAVGADTAIAFVPQFSKNPNIVGVFDSRPSVSLFRPELHGGMEPNGTTDIPEKSYIMFDPSEKTDLGHAQLFKKEAPHSHLINMPYCSHGVARVFANTEKSKSLMETALSDSPEAVRRFCAVTRRQWIQRASLISRAAQKRHPFWASHIIKKYGLNFPVQDQKPAWLRMEVLLTRSKNWLEKNDKPIVKNGTTHVGHELQRERMRRLHQDAQDAMRSFPQFAQNFPNLEENSASNKK